MDAKYEQWYQVVGDKLRNGESFDSLYEILKIMKGAGLEKEYAYNLLMNILSENKFSLDERQQDILLDLMDMVVGYCAPSARIWDIS